jgi:RecA-family ATPase
VIYCHHHSKGAQGGKKAMDRASGSGVFARDPDAQLDLIQLQIPEELQGSILSDGDTAWQLEGTLREFPNFKPVKMFFKYPNHLLDTEGVLDRFHPEGSPVNNLRNKNNTGKDDRLVAVVKALESAISFNENGATTTSEISTMTGVSQTTVKRYLRTDLLEYFTNKNGLIFKNNEADFMEDNGLIESDDNGEEWE